MSKTAEYPQPWDSPRACCLLRLVLLTGVCAADAPAGGPPRTIDFSFTSKEGYTFDGRIDVPDERTGTGYAVVLIGGGLGTDMDWTCPGEYTIDGRPHKDARRLAAALVEGGYIVMRWTAIRRDDPIHAKDPTRFTPFPYGETLDHARRAVSALEEKDLVAPNHMILLGHSNGAIRACHLAESNANVAGLILLAGGGLARTGYTADELAAGVEALSRKIDVNGDGRCEGPELGAAVLDGANQQGLAARLTDLDRNGDGTLAWHEIAAHLALTKRGTIDLRAESPTDRFGLSWPEDILARRGVPTLLLYGDQDQRTLHGHVLAHRAADTPRWDLEFKVYAGLGHLMGIEDGGKVGPMAQVVIDDVVSWLGAHFAPRPPGVDPVTPDNHD